jgi:hypothetical protein
MVLTYLQTSDGETLQCDRRTDTARGDIWLKPSHAASRSIKGDLWL